MKKSHSFILCPLFSNSGAKNQVYRIFSVNEAWKKMLTIILIFFVDYKALCIKYSKWRPWKNKRIWNPDRKCTKSTPNSSYSGLMYVFLYQHFDFEVLIRLKRQSCVKYWIKRKKTLKKWKFSLAGSLISCEIIVSMVTISSYSSMQQAICLGLLKKWSSIICHCIPLSMSIIYSKWLQRLSPMAYDLPRG